jgi:hypothetical protein
MAIAVVSLTSNGIYIETIVKGTPLSRDTTHTPPEVEMTNFRQLIHHC